MIDLTEGDWVSSVCCIYTTQIGLVLCEMQTFATGGREWVRHCDRIDAVYRSLAKCLLLSIACN